MATPATAEKLKLALNWKPEPQFGGFYAAQLHGEFIKNGLDIEIVPGGAGTPTVQLVGAGKVAFGVVSGDEIVLAQTKGNDVVALFAVYQTNPQGIMTHPERNFKSIQQVFESEGTLAWQSGLPYAQYLLKKLKNENAKIKVKQVPYAGGISFFLKDPQYSQQCFVTSEPLTAEKEKKATQVFMVADTGFNPYTTVVIVERKWAQTHQAEVSKMKNAILAGWTNYLKDPKPTNELMHKLNPAMDLESFAKSAKAQEPLISTSETQAKGLGVMSSLRWNQLIEQLFELKIIDKKPKVESILWNP
jgi:NitT/TauT family transport system substrate-binding protein